MKRLLLLILTLVSITACANYPKKSKLKALIVDGQNNHAVWPKSTVMMKQYLEEPGLFTVDVYRSRYTWKAGPQKAFLNKVETNLSEDLKQPKSDSLFAPDFKKYDVVISNFGWKAASWPLETQEAFEKYMRKGGGFVSVHAADNSFPKWKSYNEMIGIGGWGGRNEKDGPYVYYTNEGELKIDKTPGKCGAHGPKHEFPITLRVTDHPITDGLPSQWLTASDECYAKLRGPAKNMTVLATGKDQNQKAPTNRHEPVLMVIDYEKGRVFHTTLGHDTSAFEGVGFITTFLRGAEWAATGTVTQAVPDDFPTKDRSIGRPFVLNEKGI
ncbi:ThuA domain-containing protein [Reichenbachiella versicolor]|uniref:ThuA domain-containing protein n=1 Tax=Reichenbachiella versicolor TaxID=1821036 RepID=UPI000D6DF042|nr:ThuA domain-containing protein [Reichenbachiella versicolor]